MTVTEPSVAVGVDESVVARATALLPILRANAAATEAAGKLVQENVDALTESGLFGLARPARRGGLEANVRTICETLAEVATACPSSSWVLATSNTAVFSSARLPESGQERIYASETSGRMCGTFAPTAKVTRVDGGFRVSGAWAYSSGCRHADWIFAGVRVPNADGEVEGGQALIPMTLASIDTTWEVAGLKGTGSDTVVVDDAFVPDDLFLPVGRAASGEVVAPYDGPLYQGDWVPPLEIIAVAPLVGMARGALEVTQSAPMDRPLTYTKYKQSKDAPPTYLNIAEAAMKIETATLLLAADADIVDRAALAGERLTEHQHVQFRMHVGTIAQLCREAVDLLMDAGGSSAFKLSNPLQRYWRDLGISSRHAFLLATAGREFYGRFLTGAEQTAELL